MRIAVAAAAFLLPALAFAQLGIPIGEPLTLVVSPQYPRPNSTVIVTPQSTLYDLTNSTMSLTVNGKQTYSGSTRGVEVTLPGPGQTTNVSVRVTTLGRSYTDTLALRPVDVSLVTEPIATAPALYAGKAMPPQGGSVRLVAVADFRTSPTSRLDPDTLSYVWSVDGTTLTKNSGIGRHSIILPAPLAYRSRAVTVKATSPGGSLSGGDALSFASISPTLRLYVRDSLQGILFDRALEGSHSLVGSETTFVAVPYSLAASQGTPPVQWFVNGTLSETGPAITLRSEGAGEGRASLSATASGGGETVSAALSLLFGQSGNLFGL